MTGPRWLDDREQRAWRGYLAMQTELQAHLNRRLQADSGLSLSDFAVLVTLTDSDDGRLRAWVPAEGWAAGDYRLVFDVAAYLDGTTFFPEITIGFRVSAPDQHYHVPLLLNRHGYTTYRGS